MWDPKTYLKFGDERARPFADLVQRIDVSEPGEVVDLGCGPGTLTVTLAKRWPGAHIIGLDESESMLASARELKSTVDFELGDVRDWHPGPDTAVVVANAVFHWVPGHTELLTRWAGELRPGAVLAFQVPGNFSSPSHRAIHATAAELGLAGAGLRDETAILDPVGYAHQLTGAGLAVDAWETTYVHLLPETGSSHPVLAWAEGTALRPVRDKLDDAEWQTFVAALTPKLEQAYPVHSGLVYFPFRRIFVVARKP
jgi:trans-aconitate 2-methyltransferase